MPRKYLTARQRLVRQALVKSKGMISVREIADSLGVNRTTIWRDLNAVRLIRPVLADDFAEEREIKESLAWFDSMAVVLHDEIDTNESQCQEHAGQVASVGFLNVRCNLLGQLRTLKADRRDFLLRIGYIREAPKRLSLETPISEMSKADLDQEIDELDRRILELEGGLDNTSGPVEDEAEALPLPPETDH